MSIITTSDSRRIAEIATELELPGKRSMTAINKLRKARTAAQALPGMPSLQQRFDLFVLARYVPEIEARGGETQIAGERSTVTLRVVSRGRSDEGRPLYVLAAEGWRAYAGRAPSRWARLAYLVGQDDNGPFAVRVAGTCTTVNQALADIEPVEVRRARRSGKRVRRQGDLYAVETTAAHDTATGWVDWPSHHWNAETRYLTHHPVRGRKHRPVRFDRPVRFVAQSAYGMGRGGGRGAGGLTACRGVCFGCALVPAYAGESKGPTCGRALRVCGGR